MSEKDFDLDRLLKSRKVPDAPLDLSSRIIAAALDDSTGEDGLVVYRDRKGDYAEDVSVVRLGAESWMTANMGHFLMSPQFLTLCICVMICGGLLGFEMQPITEYDETLYQSVFDFDMFLEETI